MAWSSDCGRYGLLSRPSFDDDEAAGEGGSESECARYVSAEGGCRAGRCTGPGGVKAMCVCMCAGAPPAAGRGGRASVSRNCCLINFGKKMYITIADICLIVCPLNLRV